MRVGRAGPVAAALGLVLVADLAALRVLQPPAPSTVAQAVREYRATAPAPAPARRAAPPTAGSSAVPRATGPAQELPPEAPVPVPALAPRRQEVRASPAPSGLAGPGVYAYVTAGSEQVELLGTDRHDYPAQTAVVLTRSGCGTRATWSPVQGREEERLECPVPGGVELRALRSAHRFLQVDDERAFTCPPGAVVLPLTGPAGTTTSGTCTGAGGDAIAFTVQVLATGLVLQVDGVDVPVRRVRLTGLLRGSEQGRSVEDRWLTASGLLVRSLTDTTGVKETPVGSARYREHVELRLSTLQPQG